MITKKESYIFIFVIIVMILPLIGLMISGVPLGGYLEFPPLTHYVKHASFSPIIFWGLALFIFCVVTPFVVKVVYANFANIKSCSKKEDGDIPFLKRNIGWIILFFGCFLSISFWYLAWNRFAWFAGFQLYTFTPIWIGYILVVNGIKQIRTGHSMVVDSPFYLLKLFIVSALFWWFFEYLNRFVQNWYYVGIGNLTSFDYFLYATLPFSTVLPAVIGTYELLKTFPFLYRGLNNFIVLKIPSSKRIAFGILLLFAVGFSFIGIYPDYLFPLLWVSPLGIIVAIQTLNEEKTIFANIAKGDWSDIAMFAFSALICGFFWEMWNYHSVAKWVYEVPFVGSYKIFEMPLLGYSGYLPFGLECAIIANFVSRFHFRKY